jgi:CheY-like chemotaxis protein
VSTAAPKRILVVDDEADVVEALRFTIEDDGFLVVAALDEQEALAKAAGEEFDAAILDVTMKGIGGLEVAQRLRADVLTSRLPIVIFSELEESVVRKKFADYDLFVSKAADISCLGKQLALLIDGHQGTRGPAAQTPVPLVDDATPA